MSKLLLYCTKTKPYLLCEKYIDKNKPCRLLRTNIDKTIFNCAKEIAVNGKIVAECDCEVEEIDTIALSEHVYDDYYNNTFDIISKESCLTCEQMSEYLGATWDSIGYAIHIKNLHIFDKPKELDECHKEYGGDFFSNYYVPIDHAPQNMMRVWLYENGKWVMYILISIQPQWMCKILNKEKTVEVRKVVLKEMLKNEKSK